MEIKYIIFVRRRSSSFVIIARDSIDRPRTDARAIRASRALPHQKNKTRGTPIVTQYFFSF